MINAGELSLIFYCQLWRNSAAPRTPLLSPYQGLQDLRALQLLESLTDRATVEPLIDKELGMRITFKCYPHQASALLRLREQVNACIEAAL